jgi:iron complex transport system substrate-binding protein
MIGRRALVGAALALAACRRTVPVASGPARRVVSLSPSTTEALFAIGAGASVVGRSRYCDYPEEAKRLPVVGGWVDPNLEAILALAPDLVVGARGPSGAGFVQKLEARGVATYFPPTESFAEIDAMLRGLGARLGRDADAARVVGGLHARVAEVEARVAGRPRPRVLLVFGTSPVVVAGPDTFVGEMLRRAGADNVVREGSGYPTLGLERVVALDPEVVVDAAWGEGRVADLPAWRDVRAVRERRVRVLTDESVLRPGPRVGDGLDALARAVHGD